jgi:hypothetical protein
VPIEVTPRAIEVLKRALEAGRMDPALVGVRLSIDRSGSLRTGFAEEPEAGEETVVAGEVRVFVSAEIAAAGLVLDASVEHEQLVLRP